MIAATTPHVVIIGGGFGGLYAARVLKNAPVKVTLIDKRNFHLFQPLLYQVATGGLSPGEIASPLRAVLSRQKNASVLKAEVVDLDPARQTVILRDGQVSYDTLIVATGVSHHYFGNDEWAESAPGLKTIEDALEIRRRDPGSPSLAGGGVGVGDSVIADLRHGLRTCRKRPAFTMVIVGTLALGIGGTVAIFSVVNSLLLNPLPYPDADRLVMLWQGRRGAGVERDWFSGGQFSDIRSQTSVFESLALTEGGTSTLTGRGAASEVGWVRAPSVYLGMLGARAAVGRALDVQDDRAGAARVALLTHGLWERAYGSDPDVVGETITLDGRAIEIAGVLSPDLLLDSEVMPTAGGNGRVDLVLSFPLTGEMLSDRATEWYNIVGKLEPGVALARAQSELDRVAERIQDLHETDPASGFFIRAEPLLDEVVGSVRRTLFVLLGSVGGVLLIACANVANLLLVRGAARRQELGVRTAVGAGRPRLVRQLFTETAILAALGGGLGVGLAEVGIRVIRRVGAASLPRVSEIGIDGPVLLFALGITAVTCVVFGLVPARRATRVNLIDTLKSGGRGCAGGGTLWSRANLSDVLVVIEIALSFVLLVGGGLLVRSFVALERADPGFETSGRLTFRTYLSGDAYRERTSRMSFYEALEGRLASLPGVAAVGAASQVPFDGAVSWGPVSTDGYVPPQGEDHQMITDFWIATPGYFGAMGIPVIRGRAFDQRDGSDGADVAIIDERFATIYFPGRDPLGMQLVDLLGTKVTIVGVVGSVRRDALGAVSRVSLYRPLGQWGLRGMYLAVATDGDPRELVTPATEAVHDMDPDIAVVDVLSMSARVALSLAERRFSTGLLEVLGLVALALATVGIYGVMAQRVGQTVRELGLRMALGATGGRILGLVVRYGLGLALTGIAVGLLAAAALTRFIRSLLFGVGALDGWTYAAVASGLALTALLACWIPARRATRINPLEVIGGE